MPGVEPVGVTLQRQKPGLKVVMCILMCFDKLTGEREKLCKLSRKRKGVILMIEA